MGVGHEEQAQAVLASGAVRKEGEGGDVKKEGGGGGVECYLA